MMMFNTDRNKTTV